MSRTVKLAAVPVVRDENGYWYHPDAPWDEIEEQPIARYFKPHGYEASCVLLQEVMDEDEEPLKSYVENGEVNVSAWTPKLPEGEGWFLLCITDSEDGPFAMWLLRAGVES